MFSWIMVPKSFTLLLVRNSEMAKGEIVGITTIKPVRTDLRNVGEGEVTAAVLQGIEHYEQERQNHEEHHKYQIREAPDTPLTHPCAQS